MRWCDIHEVVYDENKWGGNCPAHRVDELADELNKKIRNEEALRDLIEVLEKKLDALKVKP
jgi:thioredoxin-like negative regulator of GroEL